MAKKYDNADLSSEKKCKQKYVEVAKFWIEVLISPYLKSYDPVDEHN